MAHEIAAALAEWEPGYRARGRSMKTGPNRPIPCFVYFVPPGPTRGLQSFPVHTPAPSRRASHPVSEGGDRDA